MKLQTDDGLIWESLETSLVIQQQGIWDVFLPTPLCLGLPVWLSGKWMVFCNAFDFDIKNLTQVIPTITSGMCNIKTVNCGIKNSSWESLNFELFLVIKVVINLLCFVHSSW